MDSLKDILKNKVIIQKYKKSKQLKIFYKPNYFIQAKEFSDYLGLDVYFILKCIKKYGATKVFNLRSFLKDYPLKKGKGINGLVIWKLKRNEH